MDADVDGEAGVFVQVGVQVDEFLVLPPLRRCGVERDQ